VENQEENDQNGLVKELAPSLHQESHGDFSPTVETVLTCRDFARSGGVLHCGGGRHWVFPTNTDAVEHQRESVADDPSVQRDTPGSSEHEKTAKHNQSILDETPSTTDTVEN
jgi:hypothetical protein